MLAQPFYLSFSNEELDVSFCHHLKRLFRPTRKALVEKVQQLEQQNREVKHDLRNIQARADALKQLIMGMRNEDASFDERK